MNLTYEEIEEYLEYITTGEKLVDVSGLTFVFRNPDVRIRMKARRIYRSEYDKSIEDGMVSNERMKEIIEQRNIVTQEDRDNLKKIEQLDPNSPSFRNELDKYKEANAQRIKLMGYYLPALKQTEIKASIEAKEVKNFSDMYDD